jgi:hypothetical protein
MRVDVAGEEVLSIEIDGFASIGTGYMTNAAICLSEDAAVVQPPASFEFGLSLEKSE